MSKIKKISVENLKAISELSVDFKGATCIITGRNNSGKTSFLRSLADRLRGIRPDIILKQGEKDGFYEMELTTGEIFRWEFDKKKSGEKLIYISERNIPSAVTKDISRHYFPPVFDVDEFLNSAPAKQKKTLQALTGIDFTEFDKLYKDAYDQRTFRNKQYAEEKARGEYVERNLPDEPISTETLEKEIARIDAHNMQFKTLEIRVHDKSTQRYEIIKEIERLQDVIKNLDVKRLELETQINAGGKWIADEKNKPKENAAELQKQLSDIKQQNEYIRLNNAAKLQQEKIKKAKDQADLADFEVKKLEVEKLEVIKNASMPEGFGFSDEGITYNGFEFNRQTLSSSGIYIAALKLAALGLGEVKTLHFDASTLDKVSLELIEKWADENDLQLLIELVDRSAGEIVYELVENIV